MDFAHAKSVNGFLVLKTWLWLLQTRAREERKTRACMHADTVRESKEGSYQLPFACTPCCMHVFGEGRSPPL